MSCSVIGFIAVPARSRSPVEEPCYFFLHRLPLLDELVDDSDERVHPLLAGRGVHRGEERLQFRVLLLLLFHHPGVTRHQLSMLLRIELLHKAGVLGKGHCAQKCAGGEDGEGGLFICGGGFSGVCKSRRL